MLHTPKQLAFSLKMQDREFVQEMQKLAIIKLYELGKVSSSIAFSKYSLFNKS